MFFINKLRYFFFGSQNQLGFLETTTFSDTKRKENHKKTAGYIILLDNIVTRRGVGGGQGAVLFFFFFSRLLVIPKVYNSQLLYVIWLKSRQLKMTTCVHFILTASQFE